ncbi:MAG: (S)-sulfolactate dehydrogenase [Smithella sp. PtaU1.Bin162]|nr:MAG: (S)-sulfolactate dehydrogenase [Smithella sp. PtaU1.Bin162]
MSFKVLLTESISSQGIDLLKKNVEVQIAPSPLLNDLMPLIAGADALLIRSSQAGEALLKEGRKLKVVARHGIGVDNIDLDAATRLGIKVVNTPTANTNAVAEHSLWAIMHCARNFNKVEKAFRRGDFCVPGSLPGLVQKFGYATLELGNKVLGLVGMGRIATRLAHMAGIGMGMRVKSYDPLVADDIFTAAGVERVGDLASLLKDADFISLHVPHLKETHHLIGAKELALMKPGAFLINAARGGVVDENALCVALKEMKLAGAALDVYEKEPPDKELPFFGLENVLVTPHSAAMTDLALINMAIDSAEGILDVLAGRMPKYLVNPQVLKVTG